MNNRRKLVITLGAIALAAPFGSFAQQRAIPVVGFLGSAPPEVFVDRLRAFRQGLAEAGHVEGRDVTVQYRSSGGRNEQFPELAADLIRRKVSVIALTGLPAALAAKAATTTIPIVFTGGFDPVAFGVVASMNRPGGNVTGVTEMGVEIGRKRLELLHELVPKAGGFALLVNPTNPNAEITVASVSSAARTLGLQLHVVRASTERDIDAAFADLAQLRLGGLVIAAEPFFGSRIEQIATLAIRHSVPTISQFRAFAAAGGLLAYGGNVDEQYRQAGIYAGRILKGEKAADLPVQQVTRVELFINRRTGKALGLTIPNSLLMRADEVIE